MGSVLGNASSPAAPTTGAATGPSFPSPAVEIVIDPAQGPFLGGDPTAIPDVPVTAVFLVLFMIGAGTHINIYRANAKRGHKFLLSDLIFDFCMIRNFTCIFRIIWAFVNTRGVILVALIFEFGGAAVIFAVNIFFAQRIVRSMHPRIGWHPLFGIVTLFFIWSVPAIIVLQIIALSVSFFSVGKEAQLQATETVLRVGSSWGVGLSLLPLVLLFIAAAIPTTGKPERFGQGQLTTKVAVMVYGATTLASGAVVRLFTILHPARLGLEGTIFGKAVFYTTGFMLEIIVVALYAVARVDLLFHIPNGSSKPGDYSANFQHGKASRSLGELQYDIEESLGLLGVEYQMINPPFHTDEKTEVVIAKLFCTRIPPTQQQQRRPENANPGFETDSMSELIISSRPNRVSRRATLSDGLHSIKPVRTLSRATLKADSSKRPAHPERNMPQGEYITSPPDDHAPWYGNRRHDSVGSVDSRTAMRTLPTSPGPKSKTSSPAPGMMSGGLEAGQRTRNDSVDRYFVPEKVVREKSWYER
ncbi:uncharacterized protein BCR38DRAFT_356302 [Pseudomassariella vexata]|uniref:Uncharacterized protein n=1 Tax=Pseudomassariella vexata TaxID=1141098 RepID=A0A1Y2DB25_9PEZI|nr:uncharacterized protein BCR38DRAFT_356302 [Pseudomassariella vexata]ORY55865.1 hypothetical protein BCR38DRAFT_356302 [Pseudomassariella vexata]